MNAARHARTLSAIGLALALGAARADAHLVTTGLGPVYDGIGHFFLSPQDVVPALALALLAGLRGAEAGRRALAALPLAWFAGGLVGLFANVPVASGDVAAAISFLLVGGLIAADRALSSAMVTTLACLVGGAHGFFNGLAMREAGNFAGALQLTGVALMLFVLVALKAASALSLRRPWMRIVARVAGSWVAASGLLLLGWTFRMTR